MRILSIGFFVLLSHLALAAKPNVLFIAIDDLGDGYTFEERVQVAWEDIVNEVYEVDAECYFGTEDDGTWQYPRVNFYFVEQATNKRLQSKIVTLQNIYDLGMLSLVPMPAIKD